MNLHFLRRSGAFALLLQTLLPISLQAQSLQKPEEFYFDEDTLTTRPLVLVKGSDELAQQRLLKTMNGHGRDANLAAAQLAHIAYAGNRAELGSALYGRVLAGVGANNGLRRPVLWNQGWDLYRSGDAAGRAGEHGRRSGVEALQPSRLGPADDRSWRCGPWIAARKRCSGMPPRCAPSRSCGVIRTCRYCCRTGASRSEAGRGRGGRRLARGAAELALIGAKMIRRA